MTAAPPVNLLAAPVRPRRAARGANAHPRPSAPSAAGPRAGAWSHVPRSSRAVEVATALALQAPGADAAGDGPLAPVVRLREDTVPVRRLVAASAVVGPRYEWTDRGVAVLLLLVAAVVAVMATTLVSAFLAVSPEPVPAPPSVASLVVAAPGGGR